MSPRRGHPLPIAALLLVAWLAAPPGAWATGNEEIELRARTHFAAGEYKQALEIYARLYAETLHPTYLRNIARCHQNLGDADKAITSFREYLRKAKDLTPEQRAEVEGYIAEMEEMKRTRAAQATAPPAPVAPVTPITPVPAAPPPQAAPAAMEAPLVGPPAVIAHRTEEQERAPVYTRWWFWAIVGGVAAGGIVAAVVSSGGDRAHGNLGALDLTGRTP